MTPLEVGAEAPEFSLRDQHGATVTLSSFRGRSLVVVFYPWAFTRVCEGELLSLQALLPEFENDSTALVAISCDPMHSLRAFAEADGLTFPLLSDHWPHGEVARSFGVFNEVTGAAKRSTFVLDPDGRISWSVHNEFPQERDLAEYREALRKIAK